MSPKIIKSDFGGSEEAPPSEISPSGSKVVRRAIFETGIAADDILEQARQRAAEIIADAEQRRDEIAGEARDEGRREGLAQWNDALAQIGRERDKYLSECESDVLQVAVRIAEKIIGESLKLDPALQVSIVREALKSVRQSKRATIRVHPDAAREVESKLEDLRREMPEGCVFVVKGDDTVNIGGCVIQTDTSTVNASLRDQLRYFEERFLRESKR
jgi:type III secretion system HrpE/YscL family protein